MCLTARNGLRHPKSPIMSRTSPTRFDAWSSRGGRPELGPELGPSGPWGGTRTCSAGASCAVEGRVRPGALRNPKTDDAFRAVITSLWLVLVL